MKLSRYAFLILPVLILTTMPLAAGTWVESTQHDFADGQFSTNLYSASDGSGDGSLTEEVGSVYDLDKNGYKDLIVCNFWDNGNFDCNSYIYWGSAAGFSSSNKTELLTHGATNCAVADLNKDGWLDIVFCCFENGVHYGTCSNEINSLIYWGSQTGYHAGDTTALPTNGAHGITIAKLNNDPYPEIIFANFKNDTYGTFDIDSYIYWGSHDGYNIAHRTQLPTRGANDVTVADFDKDHVLDILFSNRQTNVGAQPDIFDTDSYLYYGQTPHPNQDTVFYDTLHCGLIHTHGAVGNTVVDLDDDGWLDIVFSNIRVEATWDVHSYIYYGSATGFSPTNMDSLQTHGCVANGVADFNKDGHPDVVFANAQSEFSAAFDTSYIYWGSDSGYHENDRFNLPIVSGSSVQIGKLDHDGYLDLFMNRGLDRGYGYIFWGSQDGFDPANRDSVFTTRGGSSTKNIGNVHNRSMTEEYYSSVFGNGSTSYAWGSAAWTSDVPAGANLQVAFRTGDTPDPDDGSWVPWSAASKGAKANLPSSKYAQYRVLATANDVYEGPVLNQLSLDYTPLTGAGPAAGQPEVNSATIRGDLRSAVVTCQLAGTQTVRFAMYNLQGQLVATLASGTHPAGQLVLSWHGTDNAGRRVASGVYLCDGSIGPDRYHARVLIVR